MMEPRVKCNYFSTVRRPSTDGGNSGLKQFYFSMEARLKLSKK